MNIKQVIDALVASREWDSGSLGRFAFWCDNLGTRDIATITSEEVETVLGQLALRGRLVGMRGQTAAHTGQPLAGSTINRYINTLGSVFKYARRLRLVPRSHISPTRGIERAPELPDPERYLRPEEVERLITVSRVIDRRWRRLSALILLAFHTGLRVGNVMALRWRDVDLMARTARVTRTKNGRPIVAVLTPRVVEELRGLPNQHPDAYVFEGRGGQPHRFRRLWEKTCEEAGLPGRNFHQLRHGCGAALAMAGAGQAQVMAVLGHRTLTASARYMHSNVEDKRAVVERVFS